MGPFLWALGDTQLLTSVPVQVTWAALCFAQGVEAI